MTPTTAQAVEITVAKFITRPEAERLAILEKVRFAAGEVDGMGHPEKHQKEFSKALLPRLEQADKALAQAQRGEVRLPLPTPDETNAFILWGFGLLAKIGGGLAVIGGGLYLVGAAVVGTGEAIRIWAVANAAPIGLGIAAVLAVIGINALPRWNGEQEETPGGETPVKIQNIVNNIYISQSQEGDITVNEK